jgi:hypothetical protein
VDLTKVKCAITRLIKTFSLRYFTALTAMSALWAEIEKELGRKKAQ